MIDFLENLNLEEFGKDEELYGGLMRLAAHEGKVRPGYSGDLYINYEPGDPQFVVRVHHDDEDENKLVALGMDIHAAGNGIWDVVVSDVDVDFKKKDSLEKRIVVTGLNGKGMAVLTLVNADILPSVQPGDRLKLQVAAFPVSLDYFKDDDEYSESLKKNKFGQSYGLADGTMMPTGIFLNGNPDNADKKDIDDDAWGYMLVKGVVKHLIKGKIKIMDDELNPFVRCVIETHFGDLEIVHSFQQVKEEQRDNFKVGSVVSCLCFLSADPGIGKFADGAVYDEENDLLLYKDAITRQSKDRLAGAIAENAVYTNGKGKVFEGKADIIERMEYVYEERVKEDLHTKGYMATITEPEAPAEESKYGAGKRCLILSYEEDEYSYGAIAFIDTDENGKIARLTVSTDPGYKFRIDEKYEKDEDDDDEEEDSFSPCTDPTEAMFVRGCVNGFIKRDEGEHKDELMRAALKDPLYKVIAARAEKYIDLEAVEEEQLRKITGSLFVRAYEAECARRMGIRYERPELEMDVLGENEIQPVIDGDKEDFEDAVHTGKMMGNDIQVLQTYEDEEEMTRMLQKSLVFIQQLGKQYAQALIEEK